MAILMAVLKLALYTFFQISWFRPIIPEHIIIPDSKLRV